LSDVTGIAGFEDEVRAVVNEVRADRLGNLIAT